MRNLNGHRNAGRITAGAVQDPVHPIASPFPGVGKGLLSEEGSLGVMHADLMRFCPTPS